MKRSHKILLIAGAVGLLAANIWSIFSGHSNIAAIQNNITMSQKKVDSAMANISYSQSKIDSIQADILKFRNYISTMKAAVDEMNVSKTASEAKSDIILGELRKKASAAKQELEKVDSVPPVIKIKSL